MEMSQQPSHGVYINEKSDDRTSHFEFHGKNKPELFSTNMWLFDSLVVETT